MKPLKNMYIHTFGCQMNVYDSEKIAGLMKRNGYEQIPFPESADLIILNTCAIREKAEQKVFSFIGRLAGLKKENPHLIIAVGGCVAQQEGKRILRRMPQVDVVFGTHAVERLPGLVRRVETKRCRFVDVEMSEGIGDFDIGADLPEGKGVARFVTIMRGCDNFCAYCVVPYVRGRETSRGPERIIDEIERLVDTGVREVTLLGQNVNSYGKKEGLPDFSELLSRINEIDGLMRIRFTTSHPKDLSDELIQAFAALPKLCPHIHLPVQSGSNRILRRMNRKYSREDYEEKIGKLRRTCPDIAITSDFIAGFPGETEEDFLESLDLIRKIEFDGLFAFMYSDRSIAPSARYSGKIPEAVKKERLQRLLEIQDQFTQKKNRMCVGNIEKVLVEGTSVKSGPDEDSIPEDEIQWTGRTPKNKIVNFFGRKDKSLIGEIINIKIEQAFLHSLRGAPLHPGERSETLKGGNCCAA